MKILKQIQHNCNQVSKLHEKSKFQNLSFFEKIFCRGHLIFCKCCKKYKIISDSIDLELFANQTVENFEFSDELRNKLEKIIHEEN